MTKPSTSNSPSQVIGRLIFTKKSCKVLIFATSDTGTASHPPATRRWIIPPASFSPVRRRTPAPFSCPACTCNLRAEHGLAHARCIQLATHFVSKTPLVVRWAPPTLCVTVCAHATCGRCAVVVATAGVHYSDMGHDTGADHDTQWHGAGRSVHENHIRHQMACACACMLPTMPCPSPSVLRRLSPSQLTGTRTHMFCMCLPCRSFVHMLTAHVLTAHGSLHGNICCYLCNLT